MDDVYENYRRTFAKNLNDLMNIRDVSAKDICDVMGVSKATVSDWRNAKKMPRMKKVDILASILNVSRSDLLEEKPPMTDGNYDFLDDLTAEEMQSVKAFAALLKSQRKQ